MAGKMATFGACCRALGCVRHLGKAVRRGGRVAEGARLESVFTGNRNVGSNPTPSASAAFTDVHSHPSLSLIELLNQRTVERFRLYMLATIRQNPYIDL